MSRTCSVAGCEREVRARDWCVTHYHRWHRHGDPTALRKFTERCAVAGCDRPHFGRSMCKLHHTRWERTGDPEGLRVSTQFDTLLSHFRGGPPDECWLWTGPVGERGYGRIVWDGIYTVAHRVVYGLCVDEPDPDLHLHHSCGVRLCVNPSHLEPLSPSEHMRLHHAIRRSTKQAPTREVVGARAHGS